MKEMDVTITIATRDESDQVIGLLKGVAAWLHMQHINQWGHLKSGGEDDEIRLRINDNITYIAKVDNRIVGTFTLYDKPGEWDTYIWGSVPDDEALYLHRFMVIRDDKYRGLGVQLLRWIERECTKQDKKYIRLDCVSDNVRLNRYYSEYGFNKIGVAEHDHCKYEKHLL